MVLFEYLFNLALYDFVILGCSAPFVVLILTLSRLITKGNDGASHALTAILTLSWLFGGTWIARNAARRRVFEKEGFFAAIGSAFAEVRLVISFLPLVGKLFPLRSSQSSLLDQSNSHRSE